MSGDIFLPTRRSDPRRSKSMLASICSKLQRDVASLRAEVASLKSGKKVLQKVGEAAIAEREVAKQKRIEEREAARLEHAAFLAKQAIEKPQKDLAQEEWKAKETARVRESARIRAANRRAANPEEAKARAAFYYQRRKAAKQQIDAGVDLLGGQPS
jgi:hypothetical protein